MATDDDVKANRQSDGDPVDPTVSGNGDSNRGLNRLFGAKKGAAKKAETPDNRMAPREPKTASPPDPPNSTVAGPTAPDKSENTEEVLPELGGVTLEKAETSDEHRAQQHVSPIDEPEGKAEEIRLRGNLLEARVEPAVDRKSVV